MRRAACPALALILILSACGEAKVGDGKERKTAAGEVLGGSISDAMLPLDEVQSQSPPLRETAGGSSETAGSDSAKASDKGDDADATPSPSPSASSSPAAGASGPAQPEN